MRIRGQGRVRAQNQIISRRAISTSIFLNPPARHKMEKDKRGPSTKVMGAFGVRGGSSAASRLRSVLLPPVTIKNVRVENRN
jgi:hypothetical protein